MADRGNEGLDMFRSMLPGMIPDDATTLRDGAREVLAGLSC
jgi:4-carboxymuconolactone decarboxylase